jgi:hypothetical protein
MNNNYPHGFCTRVAKDLRLSVQTVWNALNKFTDSVQARNIRLYADELLKQKYERDK